MSLTLAVTAAALRGPGMNGVRHDQWVPRARRQPVAGTSSGYHSTYGVLQTLGRLRRVTRLAAITFSLLPLLLYTAGASGAFPEFDSCPEHVARAQQEHASSRPDHHGVHQGHTRAPVSHTDPHTTHADSTDDDDGYCVCCQGFFLAHLSGIPVAINVPIFPTRNVGHSRMHRMALEFVSAPPTPPPKPHLV